MCQYEEVFSAALEFLLLTVCLHFNVKVSKDSLFRGLIDA